MSPSAGRSDAQVIVLPGPRHLCFAELGDPLGSAVIYWHGGFSSRLDVVFAGDACRARGIRLLALDRPGIGRSGPSPGRSVLEVAAGAGALLDHLGVDTATTLGWSAGGPYALASAVALPGRITAVGTVGGMAPPGMEASASGFAMVADHLLFVLAARSPMLARLVVAASVRVPRPVMRWGMERAVGSAADLAVLRAMSDDEVAFVAEATAQGPGGVVEDYRRLGAPWGFSLGDIQVPVTVWQGDQDGLVPTTDARALASALRHCDVRLIAGAGHFLLRDHLDEVLDELQNTG